MTKQRDILLKIIPKPIEYPMNNIQKLLLVNMLKIYSHYELDAFSYNLDTYYFHIQNIVGPTLGVIITNFIIGYHFNDNYFSCSCRKHHCEHIYFIIQYFLGYYGLNCHISNGELDEPAIHILQERISDCFALAQ